MAHFGVDRSSNNALVTDVGVWKQAYDFLADLGGGTQPFVIEKCTEGEYYANPNMHPELVAAMAAGFAVSVYEFARLGSDDAGQEVAFAQAHSDGHPVEIDWEVDGTGTSAAAIQAMNDAGPRSLIYGSQSYLGTIVNQVPASRLWLAEYDGAPNPRYGCLIYQYTDALNVPGLGTCDGNSFLGSDQEFASTFDNVSGAVVPVQGDTYMVPTVQEGSAGGFVKTLQERLNAHFGQNIVVDGAFGPATLQAVKNLQAFFHMGVDGVCGPNTWAVVLGLPQ